MFQRSAARPLALTAALLLFPACDSGDCDGTSTDTDADASTSGETTGGASTTDPGTTTGTGTTTDPGTTTGADSTGTGAGSGEADSGDSSSSGEPPPVDVTVEGTVVDFVLEQPIPDVEISIYDDPGITATADSTGFYSIGTFEENTGALFILAPTEDYWGAVIPIDIGMDPLQEDVELTQISTAIVDMQIDGLAGQMPEMPNLDQAIIIVRLINNTAVMEGPTTIDMTPPPVPGTYYAPDAGGAPILDQNTIEFGLIPVVVFFNIDDSDPGDITIDATHPMRDCTVLYPELPTLGGHMTLVDVECLPANAGDSKLKIE